ncbi:MAG: aldo/keto reductase [Mangrovibacterium sp.]
MKKSACNRRKFLQLGVAATAAVAGAGTAGAAVEPLRPGVSEEPLMRTLGRTGIRLPVVSMGVMRADNPNIVKGAYKLGITLFDTAHGYQDGRNEEMLGDFFKDKPRDSFVLATKIKPPKGATADKFLEMLDLSLKRLQMEQVDILYLHAVDEQEELHREELVYAMNTAREQGKVRFLGFSTHRNMAKLIDAAAERGFYDVVLTTYNFRLAGDQAMTTALKKAHESGMGIVAMKNMAGGWLDENRTKAVNCKAALKWAVSSPYVHTCIPGIVSFEMLMENWSVAGDLNLTEKEREDLKLASRETGLFCMGCNSCAGQCSYDLPVSELMRSYMYNYAYAYPAKAWQTVKETGIKEDPCVACKQCTVQCKAGFDIRSRITNIARIQKVPEEFLV